MSASTTTGSNCVPELRRTSATASAVSIAFRRSEETELVDHGQRERDHVAAVLACVAVVGLDDVTEQEGSSSIGVSELELVVDPDAPVLRKRCTLGGTPSAVHSRSAELPKSSAN
jgi:hypothetical protein